MEGKCILFADEVEIDITTCNHGYIADSQVLKTILRDNNNHEYESVRRWTRFTNGRYKGALHIRII